MNQQGKFYFLFHFICKNCQKEFYNTNAYSPSGIINLTENYCVNCANLKYFSLSLNSQSNNSVSSFSNPYPVPSQSTNQNINSGTNFNQQKTFFEEKNNLDNQNIKISEKANQKPKPNLQFPESTPKDKRITGRTKQLNLRVKEKTYWKLKELASKNKCLMTEMFEKVLEGYEKFYKTRNYEK